MDRDSLRYDQWFATPQGRFALGAERRLLDSVVAESGSHSHEMPVKRVLNASRLVRTDSMSPPAPRR